MIVKVKVYELAKELSVDNQHLVDVIQRLGIDIKNPMSVLGTEEVRSIRDYFRKNRPVAKSLAPTAAKPSSVSEKRVGATVIRRRTKVTESTKPSEVAQVESVTAPADLEIAPIEPVTATAPFDSAVESSAELGNAPLDQTPVEGTVRDTAAKRRSFPSIIKKVGTEEYLGEVVGPKPEKKMDTKPVKEGATDEKARAPKRLKEIDITPASATDPLKDSRRRTTQRTDVTFRSADYLKRELVHATKKKKATLSRPVMKTQITTPAEHKRVVEMGEKISIGDLAKSMGIKSSAVIGKLMGLGVTATINERLDHDTATLVAHEFSHEIKQRLAKEEDFIPAAPVDFGPLESRPPVVTVMGHVDHGKTSLLDAIRKTQVAAGEAGGITQHIGAHTVVLPKGRITFIDTPGHEAFTAMRARGAKVTDLVVLVVSAVDGVMPQTLESVDHAKAASVPIIVAVNKTDLPDANPDRIRQTLAGHGLSPEDWGGDTLYVNVSAKTGQGVDQLLESILLQAEMLELKASHVVPAKGAVVESRLDKAKGPLTTVLVQQGILKRGDTVVCGQSVGKVRAMSDSSGNRIDQAFPSDPVEILGLSSVPNVGDEFTRVDDEKRARELVEMRLQKHKEKVFEAGRPRATLEQMLEVAVEEKELRIIVKADVQGSAEALKDAISKLPQNQVRAKILHTGTGGITESDVMLAAASRAIIVGFNVRPELKAQQVADAEKVEIRTYSIIYDLLDDLKKFLEGLLGSEVQEKVIGRAEVRSVFNISRVGTIAGSAVLDGKVTRNCFLRLLRDSRVVYEGKIASLKRFKDDVREVASGFECGISLENFNDVKMGDHFEAFVKEEVKRSL